MGRVSKTNSGVPGNGMVSWEFEYIETATSLHRELAGLVGATVNKPWRYVSGFATWTTSPTL